MPPLEVNTKVRGDQLRVGLAGELDIVNAPALEEELTAIQANSVSILVLDLRDLKFIDSTGLRAVIAADERARSAGARLVVVRGSKAVDRVFTLTHLDQRLEMVDDPDSVSARPVSRD